MSRLGLLDRLRGKKTTSIVDEEEVEHEEPVDTRAGGQPVTTGGGDFATSVGESIGAAIAEKYSESKFEEIAELAGGIPSSREVVKIFQTELVPRFRKLLGERLTMLYLVFMATQPPLLPYDRSTTRAEMRAVATADDTKEVLDYLKPFSEKMKVV